MYCRLCAKSQFDSLDRPLANSWYPYNQDFHIKVKKCVNVDLTEDDSFPKQICVDCAFKVSMYYEFMQQVNNAQAILRDLLARPKLEVGYDDVPHELASIKTEEIESVKEPIVVVEAIKNEPNVLQQLSPLPSELQVKRTKRKVESASRIVRKIKKEKLGNLKFAEDNKQLEGVHNLQRDVTSKEGKLYLKHYKWNCSECQQIFDDNKWLLDHFTSTHPGATLKYICNYCPKTYDRYDSFRQHLRKHRDQYKYACCHCGKNFAKLAWLKRHEPTHLSDRVFECDVCHNWFKTEVTLNSHRTRHFQTTEKTVECEQCHKVMSARSFYSHRMIHLEAKKHVCEVCGRSFSCKSNLRCHIAGVHNNDTPFNCGLCTRSFKTRGRFNRHVKTHSNVKNHKCETCGRRFLELRGLRAHALVHSTELPFECEHCHKRFRLKDFLRIHLRQHTGERPYSCSECTAQFANYSNYRQHMQKRHKKDIRSIHTKLILKHKGLSNSDSTNPDSIKNKLKKTKVNHTKSV